MSITRQPDSDSSRTSVDEKIVSGLESAFGESEDGVRNDAHGKTQRTKGLLLFDNVLFNLTNLSVFALSVYATYKTNFSQAHDTPKELQNWWMKRGNEAKAVFRKAGMSEEGAKNANMVLWSFVDGTAVAPLVAIIENKRNDIGSWLDGKLGTRPKEEDAYAHQPKQGFKSVFTGRLAAAAIVIPTYFALDAKSKKPGAQSINNIIFDKTAEAIVRHDVAGIPGALEKYFPKLHVKGLVTTAVFETFYATLCTTILFAVSYLTGKHDHHKNLHAAEKQATSFPVVETPEMTNGPSWKEKVHPKQPVSHIESVTLRRNTADYRSAAWSS